MHYEGFWHIPDHLEFGTGKIGVVVAQVMCILIITDGFLELCISITVRMVLQILLMQALDSQIAVVCKIRDIIRNQFVQKFPLGRHTAWSGFYRLEEAFEFLIVQATGILIGKFHLIGSFLVLGKNTASHVELFANGALRDIGRKQLECTF